MDRCVVAMGSLADMLGQPMLDWTVTYARATQALIAGDPERAEELVLTALQLGAVETLIIWENLGTIRYVGRNSAGGASLFVCYHGRFN